MRHARVGIPTWLRPRIECYVPADISAAAIRTYLLESPRINAHSVGEKRNAARGYQTWWLFVELSERSTILQ